MVSKQQSFCWTDDETELLLQITNEYKVEKIHECIDWESVQEKYVQILDRMKSRIPSEEEAKRLKKEFPHSPDEFTKQSLTTKLKAIRTKYRKAIDSGRRSGHGRVVSLFFEQCNEIWGGSPATGKIAGVETNDLVENEGDDNLKVTTTTVTSLDSSSESISEKDSSLESEGYSSRRSMLDEKLANYRKEKLKRKLPTDEQILHLAKEDLKFKKQMMSHMANVENQYKENMGNISSNLEKLTSVISDGIALLVSSSTKQTQSQDQEYASSSQHFTPPPPPNSQVFNQHSFMPPAESYMHTFMNRYPLQGPDTYGSFKEL